jgi:hypothetical protein
MSGHPQGGVMPSQVAQQPQQQQVQQQQDMSVILVTAGCVLRNHLIIWMLLPMTADTLLMSSLQMTTQSGSGKLGVVSAAGQSISNRTGWVQLHGSYWDRCPAMC